MAYFVKLFQQAKKNWALSLIGSLALSYFGTAVLLTNPFGLYAPRKMIVGFVAVPFVFLILSYWIGGLWLSYRASISKRNWLEISIWSAAVAIALFFIFPNPQPLISQNHQLKLIAGGEKNKFSSGSIVEIRKIRTLEGKEIPFDQFLMSGDWQISDGILFSPQGGSKSVVEMSGMIPGGIVISLRYLGDGGKIRIQWDGSERVIDLYTSSASSTIEDFVLDGFSWSQLTLVQTGLILVTYVGYFLGLFVIVFFFSVVIRSGFIRPKIVRILLVLAYLVVFGVYLRAKFSYDEFSGNRPFRDSRSYVQSADLSITSLEFWAGERPFTFPLALKLLDVHYSDGWSNAVMERTQMLHVWLSIGSWGLLALLTSFTIRQNWLKPFAFGCILFFSLNLEIGIWDGLMLSESLSFSFFALLVAGWVGWQWLPDLKSKTWIQVLFLMGLSLITILYSFVRDSNQYFLLIAGALFFLRIVIKRKEEIQKRNGLIYIFVILLILILQNLSISVGNRWQVFIYDHLAYRILANDSARTFFAAHGLPISDSLSGIVKMEGFQYQEMIKNDPKMQQVKQWVDQSGKTTYFLYLLNDFGNSLIEPIRQIPDLLDGSTLGYHFPTYASRPFSKQIIEITDAFYFRWPVLEWLAGLTLLGGSIWWLFKGRANSPWFVIMILTFSIYPLMFIVWHGEPMEIARHALQIGIQFRLAAWMACVFLIDAISLNIFSPKTTIFGLQKEKSDAEV